MKMQKLFFALSSSTVDRFTSY